VIYGLQFIDHKRFVAREGEGHEMGERKETTKTSKVEKKSQRVENHHRSVKSSYDRV